MIDPRSSTVSVNRFIANSAAVKLVLSAHCPIPCLSRIFSDIHIGVIGLLPDPSLGTPVI